MIDATIYYCWSCDAHCRLIAAIASEARCPRCGALLAEGDRVATIRRSVLGTLSGPPAKREPVTMPA